MAAISVIFNRKNRAVDKKEFNKIFCKLDYRGPDGKEVIYRGNLAIGHQHFWTTPEEVGENQPLVDEYNNLVLAFNGRIDNREELLQMANIKDHNISDAKLILMLYNISGIKLFGKIIGPFIVVIHDKNKNELLVIRDTVGDRTVFYYMDSNIFIASTEEQSILAHPFVSREFDEESIVKFLTLSLPDYDRTFFKDISELPPAHYIKLSGSKFELSKYWEIKKSDDPRYHNKLDELAYEFRTVLENSIKACMRSVYKPAVMMSGGLDSTTVAYFVSMNLSALGFSKPLNTISGVFNELKNCDESGFINDLEKRIDINSIKIPCDDTFPLCDDKVFYKNPNTPFEDPFRMLTERVYLSALKNDNKVLLTGHYAEELYNRGYYDYILELLLRGNFLEILQNIITIFKKNGTAGVFKSPALRRLFGFYRKIINNNPPMPNKQLYTEYALRMISQINSNNKKEFVYLNENASKLSIYEYVNAAIMNVDVRFPYRNRNLIEFMHNIPAFYLYNRQSNKVILKRAVKDDLPDCIIHRQDNISLSDLLDNGINKINLNSSDSKNEIWRKYIRTDNFNNPAYHERNDSYNYKFLKWFSVSIERWKNKHDYI